jgi:hypothetical protein
LVLVMMSHLFLLGGGGLSDFVLDALDDFFACELVGALKKRRGAAGEPFVVAAPMLYESKADGSLADAGDGGAEGAWSDECASPCASPFPSARAPPLTAPPPSPP